MRTFAIIAATAALTSTISTAAKADLKVGDPAPPLSVSKWVKGTPNKLTPGKVHVVEFWATWCGPCKATIPHITELSKRGYQSRNHREEGRCIHQRDGRKDGLFHRDG